MTTQSVSIVQRFCNSTVLAVVFVLIIASGIGAQAPIPTVDVREEVRIQSNDSVPGMLLTRVEDLVVLPDGRILTVHMREGVVRVFDPRGRLIKVIGRRGDGPGEFPDPVKAGYVGDRIWVRDHGRHRYQLFDARTYELIGSVAAGPNGGSAHGLTSDTTSLFTKSVRDSTPHLDVYGRTGERRMPLALGFRLAGHHFEIEVPGTTPEGMLTGRNESRTIYSPLLTATRIALVPGGREAFALEASELWKGPPGQFTIRRIETATGRISSPVTVPLPVRRITSSEADSLLSITPGVLRFAIRRSPRLLDEYRGKAKVPVTYPAFNDFLPSADGVLWLTEYARPDTRLVVDVSGKPLMRVRLPKGFVVHAVSRTHVWGVTLDADDLPIISRYRIQP
jgi:hypothetical protein